MAGHDPARSAGGLLSALHFAFASCTCCSGKHALRRCLPNRRLDGNKRICRLASPWLLTGEVFGALPPGLLSAPWHKPMALHQGLPRGNPVSTPRVPSLVFGSSLARVLLHELNCSCFLEIWPSPSEVRGGLSGGPVGPGVAARVLAGVTGTRRFRWAPFQQNLPPKADLETRHTQVFRRSSHLVN